MEKSMLELIEETQRVLLKAAIAAAKEAESSTGGSGASVLNCASAAKTLVDAAHAAASLGTFHK